jgi:hypothetical protein
MTNGNDENGDDDSSNNPYFGMDPSTIAKISDTVKNAEANAQSAVDSLRGASEIHQTLDRVSRTASSLQVSSETLEAAVRAAREVEETTQLIESTLDIDPPWNYTRTRVVEDDLETAMRWLIQACIQMEDTGIGYFEGISDRIRKGCQSLAGKVESGTYDGLYGPTYIFVSSQDSLTHWLCEQDPDISQDNSNRVDDPIYSSGTKRNALEKWYETHSVAGIETGSSFSQKWDNYFQHRHKIMHGDPNAYYDLKVVVASMWFLTLTAHVAIDRSKNIP